MKDRDTAMTEIDAQHQPREASCATPSGGPAFTRRTVALGLVGTTVLAIAGCAAPSGNPRPAFYQNLAEPGARFQPQALLSMVNGYRANNGLPPVALDPQLMSLAQGYAREIGDRARRTPTVRPDGRLEARLLQSGYRAADVEETVTAGYYTIAEAFSGWRDSPDHNATMLMRDARDMGAAAQFMPNTKYKVYWVLIMARPDMAAA